MYNVVNQDLEGEGMNITLFQLLLRCIEMVYLYMYSNEVVICLQLCTMIKRKINPVKPDI